MKHSEKQSQMNSEMQLNLKKRLARIEGQVRGVALMIEQRIWCDDVLDQISSIQSALDGVKQNLFESHLQTCLIPQMSARDGQKKQSAQAELMKSVKRLASRPIAVLPDSLLDSKFVDKSVLPKSTKKSKSADRNELKKMIKAKQSNKKSK